MCELNIGNLLSLNTRNINIWHVEKVMQPECCRKKRLPTNLFSQVSFMDSGGLLQNSQTTCQLGMMDCSQQNPQYLETCLQSPSLYSLCGVYTVVHDPAQSHFNSFQLLVAEDRNAITRIAKRTWTSNARTTMPDTAFPLRLLQLRTTFSTHCAHDPFNRKSVLIVEQEPAELFFNSMGVFSGSWSPMILHCLFYIQNQ